MHTHEPRCREKCLVPASFNLRKEARKSPFASPSLSITSLLYDNYELPWFEEIESDTEPFDFLLSWQLIYKNPGDFQFMVTRNLSNLQRKYHVLLT